MARKLRQTKTTYVLYSNKEVLWPPFVATKFLRMGPLRAYSGKTQLHAVEQNCFIKQFGITRKLTRRLTYLALVHACMHGYLARNCQSAKGKEGGVHAMTKKVLTNTAEATEALALRKC